MRTSQTVFNSQFRHEYMGRNGYIQCLKGNNSKSRKGWSDVAMVLGKLPVPGHLASLMIAGQGPVALAVGAGWGCFGHFYSSLSLPLFGRRPDID